MTITQPRPPHTRTRLTGGVDRAPRRWTLSRTAVNAALILATAYTLLPVLWLLTASGKDTGDLIGGRGLALDRLHLGANLRALAEQDGGIYFRWYLNSLLYAGIGALVCAFVCVCAGYAFQVYAFRGKEKLFGIVLLGVLIPTTALALPMYLVASKIGLVNTFWAVFIPTLVNPFGVYLARVFTAGYVPGDVLEAARVDGAGELRTFWQVGLRMVLPGFTTVFLFQFTAIWNNFLLPLVMLANTKLFPLSLGLYSWNSQTSVDPTFYPLVVLGSLLAILPLIIAFVCLQRFWKAGLTAGSVK
ncbi:MAG TPA: carbohydrate ABC transporter permease [Pseudonocardiaceae bacterium]|jgi:multiple sugar transport system permease protein